MDKKIKISELPEFDATRYLEDEKDIAMYLTCVLEENDAALLAAALGDIAKARGMTEVAKKAGITREALYKALRPNASPRFDTISRVCQALGVRLEARPIQGCPPWCPTRLLPWCLLAIFHPCAPGVNILA
jgi:probable addiction module antidote protein